MKIKIILAVLVLFSTQMVYGIADAQSYNTSGSKSGGSPVYLKSYTSNTNTNRTSSYRSPAESKSTVYGSNKQNSDKYRLSMSSSDIKKTRDNHAKQEKKRIAQRDETSAKRLAKAQEAMAAKEDPQANSAREVSLRQERAEVKEQTTKKKKKRIYKKTNEEYKMPERVFNFN